LSTDKYNLKYNRQVQLEGPAFKQQHLRRLRLTTHRKDTAPQFTQGNSRTLSRFLNAL